MLREPEVESIRANGGAMYSYDRLLWLMQVVNVASLSLLFAPISLRVLFGLNVYLSTEHDYLHSIKPFVPDVFLRIGFRSELPIQALQVQSETVVYFPGVAIDCILGTLQCIWLGLDLIFCTPRQGALRFPLLPAVTLFLYAGMCMAALPLHCIKDFAVLDIASPSILAQFLLWADTFCTACVPPIMLLSGLLVEAKIFLDSSYQQYMWIALVFNAIATFVGVWLSSRWIIFLLHVVFQVLFLFPLFYLTQKRVLNLNCPHGIAYMKLGNVGSIVGVVGAIAFASILSVMSGGNFCPLTSVFVTCRIGMVQYWAFYKSQAHCHCVDKKRKS